ncbi:hypothetical protein [Cognatishimia sp. MH4019]|uniref:hypothetical protein n=1 Tax=Cognatishimia sp. MH4019 TaxID=2854030 RepID=UPI001CD4F9AB|nr:hypothetical protein [Cognatishimia sp. MH4019]
MATLTLTKTRLQAGIWEGVMTWDGAGNLQPDLVALHLDQPIMGISIKEDPAGNAWNVQIPVPIEAISDGVHTIVVIEKGSGETLTSFALIAGEPLSEDIRTETALLRAELDMLKRAFRRHCLETMG